MLGEDQETCRACGDIWYSKWYKDGFCDKCQKDGTYEDFLFQRHISRIITITLRVVMIGVVALSLYFILK